MRMDYVPKTKEEGEALMRNMVRVIRPKRKAKPKRKKGL